MPHQLSWSISLFFPAAVAGFVIVHRFFPFSYLSDWIFYFCCWCGGGGDGKAKQKKMIFNCKLKTVLLSAIAAAGFRKELKSWELCLQWWSFFFVQKQLRITWEFRNWISTFCWFRRLPGFQLFFSFSVYLPSQSSAWNVEKFSLCAEKKALRSQNYIFLVFKAFSITMMRKLLARLLSKEIVIQIFKKMKCNREKQERKASMIAKKPL